MKRAGLIVSWAALAALLSAVAYQIVAAAESRVSDDALTPIVAITAETSVTTDSSPETNASTSTTTPSDPSTSVPSSTTPTTTATTTPSSSTTTVNTSTTSGATWTSRTVPSAGGDVVIEYRPGEVRLVVARPGAGYKVEVESAGPPSVQVEFENESTDEKIRVEARWENGELEVKIEGPEGKG